MNRTAAVKRISILALVLVLVAAGGMGLYFYTSAPKAASVAASGTSNGIKMVSNQGQGGDMTVQFNGTSYQVAAKAANAPSFSCPVGADPGLCTLLQATCGNGVGPDQEPWKNCMNCSFDAGCSGQQTCDPYTLQCSIRVSACQVAAFGGQ